MAKAADLNFLIVEDDEFQRRWIGAVVANLGGRNIIEVGDGAAALAVLQDKSQRIDITFIDLSMPGMDGLELIRHIAKENHRTAAILVSALDTALLFSVDTMARAYGVETLGTIEKPATPENVQALIDAFVPPQARRKTSESVGFSFGDLQQALKNKEFDPLFQPKVELATGQMKGVEAFARWLSPEHGTVLPGAFIPVLEEHGEMEALAWIIIEKSLAAWHAWRAQGVTTSVSINLSPSVLARPGMANRVIDFLANQNVEPHYFIFEVTESATVTNLPYFLENLARLRMRGFGLSVDDYGMGQASMQELMRIPFTELKIDRSFVAGACQNQALELVLSSSLEICQRLNRHSVAVGVETQQDWEFLLQRNCTYAQGYYIARPMEAVAIPGWAREWSQFF